MQNIQNGNDAVFELLKDLYHKDALRGQEIEDLRDRDEQASDQAKRQPREF